MQKVCSPVVRLATGVVMLMALCSCTDHANDVSSLPITQPSLKLQRVVMLMRHSVRPPTKPQVIPSGYANTPWPEWNVPAGYLTRHGFQGAMLLGKWNRRVLADRGLLPATGCPAAGSVNIHADTDQRTRQTGVGFAKGLAPGCDIAVSHTDGDRDDPLFAPMKNLAVPYDPRAAKEAILARVGHDLGSAAEVFSLHKAFNRLDAILGCCSLPLCKASGLPEGCQFGELHNAWEKVRPHERVDVIGPLSVGGTASESILLEYANDKPMKDVGWGRIEPGDLRLLSRIHAAQFDLLARTPYAASHAGTPIMQHVLKVFDSRKAPKLTVLVGHDTNVANVAGMLDVHWHAPGYARDDPAINGTLGFELLEDAKGNRYVRVFYQAQSLEQLRTLQKLDAGHPPYVAYLEQPRCAPEGGDATVCTLADFERAVRARLVD